MRKFVLPALLMVLLTGTAALADISVRFTESAPKDRFHIANLSACPTGPLEIVIDLSGSAAGLIFDTTGSGAGVSVYQPFELVAGAEQVEAASEITDGDSRAVLRLSELPVKGEVAFTIDVDDTLPASYNGQTMISGAEIKGARLLVRPGSGSTIEASFDSSGDAIAPLGTCLS